MRVNKINNSKLAFERLTLSRDGARVLAEEFVKNPELEGEFILNIARPLQNTEHTDVYYDGITASIITDKDINKKISVIHAYGTDSNTLGIIAQNGMSNAYRRTSDVQPTSIFQSYFPLNEIEIAKNIATDIEEIKMKASAKVYSKVHENEPVDIKAARLYIRFS